MAAAAAAAAFAGSSLTAAANVGSSIGAAEIQSNTAKDINTQNLEFQKNVINSGLNSFRQVGLPDYLYWSGGIDSGPNTMFHLGGSNFYEGSGVNANLPVFSTPQQQWYHSGTPSMQKEGDGTDFTQNPRLEGTFNRAGLGYYSSNNTRYGMTEQDMELTPIRGNSSTQTYAAISPGNIYNTQASQAGRSFTKINSMTFTNSKIV